MIALKMRYRFRAIISVCKAILSQESRNMSIQVVIKHALPLRSDAFIYPRSHIFQKHHRILFTVRITPETQLEKLPLARD